MIEVSTARWEMGCLEGCGRTLRAQRKVMMITHCQPLGTSYQIGAHAELRAYLCSGHAGEGKLRENGDHASESTTKKGHWSIYCAGSACRQDSLYPLPILSIHGDTIEDIPIHVDH